VHVHGMSVRLVLLGILVLRRGRKAAVEQRSRGQRPRRGCVAVRRTNALVGIWVAGADSDAVNNAFGVVAGAGLRSTGVHKQRRRRRPTRRRRRRRLRSSPPAGRTKEVGLVGSVHCVVAAVDNSERDKHSSLGRATSRELPTLTSRSSACHRWRCKDARMHLLWVVQPCSRAKFVVPGEGARKNKGKIVCFPCSPSDRELVKGLNACV